MRTKILAIAGAIGFALVTTAAGAQGYGYGPYGSGAYNNGPYNSGPYNSGSYNNGPYGSGAYNNGPYNNGPYNNGPYNNGPYDNSGYTTYNGTEEVIVSPPSYGPSRSAIGAPYKYVAISRGVRIDDLDLRTDWGVAQLRERIGITAQALCRRMNALYPISADDTHISWPTDTHCYDNAVDRAWVQADHAIQQARYGNYPTYGGYGGGYGH